MNVEAGQVLTKKGLVQQELFVIIDGRYEVYDEKRVASAWWDQAKWSARSAFSVPRGGGARRSEQLPRGRC